MNSFAIVLLTTTLTFVSAAETAASARSSPRSMPETDSIFELRDYKLQPGQREILIALFESKFIESQDVLGAHVDGIFRDLDRPDRFVWIRSFSDMAARKDALTAFYGGPAWHANSKAANATMIDTDDVYLLRPGGEPLHLLPGALAAPARHLYVADIWPLTEEQRQDFERAAAHDSTVIATFSTEQTANNFPSLPVHADAVFVVLRCLASGAAVSPIGGLPASARTLRLAPTDRSPLQ